MTRDAAATPLASVKVCPALLEVQTLPSLRAAVITFPSALMAMEVQSMPSVPGTTAQLAPELGDDRRAPLSQSPGPFIAASVVIFPSALTATSLKSLLPAEGTPGHPAPAQSINQCSVLTHGVGGTCLGQDFGDPVYGQGLEGTYISPPSIARFWPLLLEAAETKP